MAKAKSGAGRLAWTSAPPDAPGWYWLQGVEQIRTARPRPVQVYLDKAGRLSVCAHSLAWWRDAGMHFLWAGPIEEPPDPMTAMEDME